MPSEPCRWVWDFVVTDLQHFQNPMGSQYGALIQKPASDDWPWQPWRPDRTDQGGPIWLTLTAEQFATVAIGDTWRLTLEQLTSEFYDVGGLGHAV